MACPGCIESVLRTDATLQPNRSTPGTTVHVFQREEMLNDPDPEFPFHPIALTFRAIQSDVSWPRVCQYCGTLYCPKPLNPRAVPGTGEPKT